MRIQEVRSEEEFQSLRSSWDALLRQSASGTIFLTWEWISAWWSAYGSSGDLRILTAVDEAGELLGIAPLRRCTLRRYHHSAAALRFIGDGSNDSDYLDFLIASGREGEVMEAFGRYMDRELHKGTVLQLNEIPATSPNVPLLNNLAEARGLLTAEKDVPCGTVHLPATWDEYLGILKPRFRTKIRSVLRNLEGRSEVRFGLCETEEQVGTLLPVLFDLHSRRWALEGKPGVFGTSEKRAFYLALSKLLLDRGWLRFSWLRWNDRVLACQYGFEHAGTYFQLQEGYEPSAEHFNVGLGLRAWSIREFLNHGVREYDFLGGVGRHKSDWGAETKQSKQILIGAPTWKTRVLAKGPEWEVRARETVRHLIPEKLLAARAARMKKVSGPASNGTESMPGGRADWTRQAIANFYFHSSLPKLTRRLRDHFQLTRGHNSRFPWSRRTAGAARILYYHRVNDEQDPFFPALSTRLFEEEMRFLSRHHKVVSLAELVQHLERGSRENVIAITFDDGYRDNYENAFPILQRYGLPATIFLTTGSLDTGDPLWFEQLADALKKTGREYIDLEMDIPRRFWTRTLQERLDANDRIFALLRGVDDAQRREWLQRILVLLAAPDPADRRNRMLSWDQVRLMKSRGIDFGGHTVTHPFLSRLSRDQVAWEVSECKRRIEDELQLAVGHFAYPNGREEDFGLWNKEVIRESGYDAAVTTIWGINDRSTDPMALRRGGPWEETPAMFAYKLDWYQLANA